VTEKRKKIRKKRTTEKGTEKLNELKEEIARDLGLDNHIARRGWANLSSRETGKIGGYMAQRLKKKGRGDQNYQGRDPGKSK